MEDSINTLLTLPADSTADELREAILGVLSGRLRALFASASMLALSDPMKFTIITELAGHAGITLAVGPARESRIP